jgi:hypothetical protein
MMVGLAMATMVESTMIMKKPIIIAHSASQGFPCGAAPGDRGAGVVICPHLISAPHDAAGDARAAHGQDRHRQTALSRVGQPATQPRTRCAETSQLGPGLANTG